MRCERATMTFTVTPRYHNLRLLRLKDDTLVLNTYGGNYHARQLSNLELRCSVLA